MVAVSATDGGTPAPRLPREASPVGAGDARAMALAVAGWGVLVLTAIVVGPRLLPEEASLRAPPVMGHWTPGVTWAVVLPLAMAVGAVAYGPRFSANLRWPALVVGAGAATTAWSVALAAVDGWPRVALPLSSRHEYLAAVDQIEGPGDFLRTFIERFDSYPIHVQGHPPGMPLVLWGLDQLGMSGTGWAAGLVLAGAGLATSATLVAVRSVAGGSDLAAGEQVARNAAPFVAFTPAAVWLGTSADALFAGVIALGIALLVTVPASPTGRRAALAAYVAGGAVLACALFLTYGTVPLLVIPAGVWLYRRDIRPLLWAAGGAAAVTAGFWASGFWWFDGLDATRAAYETGVSADRPYALFVPLLNPAAFALATGPAVAAALGLWVTRRHQLAVTTWLLPTLAVGAVLVANLSGLSKGEVERIWLPFVPWLLVACALLPRARWWLAATTGTGLALQLFLHSPW